MKNGVTMDNGNVSLEDFLLKEHEQSYKHLMHMDDMLSSYFWLYIILVVAITAVDGIIVGLGGVGPDVLIFISVSCAILLLVGLTVLRLMIHTRDEQNLTTAYVQEIVFYFMGKGLKPVSGNPRNQEAARILDFKHVFDQSHRNDWHMRRRKHIQGYGSSYHTGDSWVSGYTAANKMTFFLVMIISGLVAFTVASFASGAMWGSFGLLETSQRSGQYLYFGMVLGMEFFVASWVFLTFTLRSRMKQKREIANDAFQRKREVWFGSVQDLTKVEDMIESTISKSRGLIQLENTVVEEPVLAEESS
ncbi:MAG: hypothetical protein E3J35_05910 [Methanomassiliicoccales archaeon]|nr:MAG: hypothetical protein E3J35_05910 [Methanomassiliicoccales archaeon]